METARRARPRSPTDDDIHARDFYTWTRRQAELLRAGLFETIDVEEIETCAIIPASS